MAVMVFLAYTETTTSVTKRKPAVKPQTILPSLRTTPNITKSNLEVYGCLVKNITRPLQVVRFDKA